MKDSKIVHEVVLALGSNLGNRYDHLAAAMRLIEESVGFIDKQSGIYETPADGFSGGDFLNMAVTVHTVFSATEVLEKILTIEVDMGRVRTGKWSDRPMDIDILLYDELQISTTDLTVPHPRMLERNYVMAPLVDILPDATHPVQQVAFKKLAEGMRSPHLKEDLPAIATLREDFRQRFRESETQFIAIEGNIGSGKTSLTQRLAADFNAEPIYERFADNPFLPKFYEQPERYSFPLEMSFLADRYQQISDHLSQGSLFHDFKVADYYVVKSLIFSKINLTSDEFRLYERLFSIMYKQLVKPDLYVYLYQDDERLLKNIAKRGRPYEQNIEKEYLQKIQRGYADFLRTKSTGNVLRIDVSSMDFMASQEDYISLVKQITTALKKD